MTKTANKRVFTGTSDARNNVRRAAASATHHKKGGKPANKKQKQGINGGNTNKNRAASLPPCVKRQLYPNIKLCVDRVLSAPSTDATPKLAKVVQQLRITVMNAIEEETSSKEYKTLARKFCSDSSNLKTELQAQLEHTAGARNTEASQRARATAVLKTWFPGTQASSSTRGQHHQPPQSSKQQEGRARDKKAGRSQSKNGGRGGGGSHLEDRQVESILRMNMIKDPNQRSEQLPALRKSDIPSCMYTLIEESLCAFTKPYVHPRNTSAPRTPPERLTSGMLRSIFPQFAYRSLKTTHGKDMYTAAQVVSEHDATMKALLFQHLRRIVASGAQGTSNDGGEGSHRARDLLALWSPKPTPTPTQFLKTMKTWNEENPLPNLSVPDQIHRALLQACEECIRSAVSRSDQGRRVPERHVVLTQLFPAQCWPSECIDGEDKLFECAKVIAHHRATLLHRLDQMLKHMEVQGENVTDVRRIWFPKRSRRSSHSASDGEASGSPPRRVGDGKRSRVETLAHPGTSTTPLPATDWASECDSSFDTSAGSPIAHIKTTTAGPAARKKKRAPFIFSV